MAKKTNKKIKKLSKAVKSLQDQNEELSEKLSESLEEQAQEIQDIKATLESRQEADESQPDEEALEDEPKEDQPDEDQPEVVEVVEATEPAERRAKELGVELSVVKGTGSGGRILVSDVEEAADADD